jgi:hypothetical protein
VMRRSIEVRFDHRIYNPPDEMKFAEGFLAGIYGPT